MKTTANRNWLRLALIAALCNLAALYAHADFNQGAIGTAGSEFLNLDVGPRGIAMGSAYCAISDDATSMYWNPAGLAQIPKISVSAMHTEYLADIRYQYISYAQRLNESYVLGGALRYFNAGDITNTDINGNTVGTFQPRDYVYEMGWGSELADLTDSERQITMGMVGRYFNSDRVAHADGFSADVGLQARYTQAAMPYSFGFVAQNFGRGQKFDQVRDNLPFRARAGASLLPTSNLLLSIEMIFPVANQPYGALGTELTLHAMKDAQLFLRGGYNSAHQFNGLDGLNGISLGTGIRISNFSFDYAFVPVGILGNAHRFSVTWNLASPSTARKYRER